MKNLETFQDVVMNANLERFMNDVRSKTEYYAKTQSYRIENMTDDQVRRLAVAFFNQCLTEKLSSNVALNLFNLEEKQ